VNVDFGFKNFEHRFEVEDRIEEIVEDVIEKWHEKVQNADKGKLEEAKALIQNNCL
jgi:vacuolar-type H+-ATPase subunit E/Vma4